MKCLSSWNRGFSISSEKALPIPTKEKIKKNNLIMLIHPFGKSFAWDGNHIQKESTLC